MLFAILDLGTNTFHLLIADVKKDGTWKAVMKERVTVKIGQGGINKRTIAPAPYRRGIGALEKFNLEIRKRNIKKVAAFGTAALRTADNGKEFISEVLQKTGIKIKLISGKEEASLIYSGVKQAIKKWKGKILVMDIGGGSVEYIIADENKLLWKQSFKLGAALLLDKFHPSDPLNNSNLRIIKQYLNKELVELYNACVKYQPETLVGSAGSFETFASMIRHKFPESGSHYGKTEHPISLKHFNELYKELIVSNKQERSVMKGLIKMRMDMIVLAAIILKTVLDKTKITTIKLSAYSLKEGALVSITKSKT